MKVAVSLLAVLSLPFTALACPVHPPVSERMPELFEALAASPNDHAARVHADQVWRTWVAAPDARAQQLLDAGIQQMRVADYEGAQAELSKLVAYCPDYAEGWNQRAYAHFLQGNYDASLLDIEETLSREPSHFGALSGRLRIFISQGRISLARRTLKDALKIHPFMSERFLLPAEPAGRDI